MNPNQQQPVLTAEMLAGELSDKARGIINDIAEGIDCGESRMVLRGVIAEMADAMMCAHETIAAKTMARDSELLERMTTKLDSLAVATQSQQLQPIETAPKDGTKILVAAVDDGVVFDVLNGHFEVLDDDEEDGPWDIRDGEPWCSYEGREAGIYFCYWLPEKEFYTRALFSPSFGYTHWMPLPASPATVNMERRNAKQEYPECSICRRRHGNEIKHPCE